MTLWKQNNELPLCSPRINSAWNKPHIFSIPLYSLLSWRLLLSCCPPSLSWSAVSAVLCYPMHMVKPLLTAGVVAVWLDIQVWVLPERWVRSPLKRWDTAGQLAPSCCSDMKGEVHSVSFSACLPWQPETSCFVSPFAQMIPNQLHEVFNRTAV